MLTAASFARFRYAMMSIHFVLCLATLAMSPLLLINSIEYLAPGFAGLGFAVPGFFAALVYIPAALILTAKRKDTQFDRVWGELLFIGCSVFCAAGFLGAAVFMTIDLCDPNWLGCDLTLFPIIEIIFTTVDIMALVIWLSVLLAYVSKQRGGVKGNMGVSVARLVREAHVKMASGDDEEVRLE